MSHSHRSCSRFSRVEALEDRRLFAAGDVLASVTHPTSGHVYHLLDRSSWPDAEAKSVQLGGHLVTVNDPAEQAFLWNTFGPRSGIFWIGINDAAHQGRFTWSSGEPATYTNWFPGEPNNLYSGEVWGNMWLDYGGQWNDLGPSSTQGNSHFGVAEVRDDADLFATISNVPLAVQPGGTLEASGTLTNIGSRASSGTVRIAYYLSSDAALDGADRLLGDQVVAANLTFNSSAPIGAGLAIPSDLAPGTYVLLAQVDAGGAVAEADEGNNLAMSRAIHVGAELEPVFRAVRGEVQDVDSLPLHGVSVQSGGVTVFTDYDGKKSALDRDGVNGDFELPRVLIGHNVSFAGVFARFVPAESSDAIFTATAGNLAGATHTKTVAVDEILTLDAAKPDGGLAETGIVVLRPIFLTHCGTKSADGTLNLHRDLRNDRNSHRLTTKPNKMLVPAWRYTKAVESVTARLAQLGFRETGDTPLATVSAIGKKSPAERAILLFKELTCAPGAKPKKFSAVIDEATLAALNACNPADGPFWTNVLPAKWSIAPGVTDSYVGRATFDKMRQLAESSPNVSGFVLTRGSPSIGGSGKTFRAGREIEFRWIDTAGTSQTAGPFWEPLEGFERSDVKLIGGKKLGIPDPAQLGIAWRYVAGYDQTATAGILQSLLNIGATRVRFNDPLITQQTPTVLPGAGYDAVIYAAM